MINIKIKIMLVNVIINLENLLLNLFRYLFFKLPRNDHKNICVFKTGNIGDIICVIPALKYIKKQFPMARITILTSPGSCNAVAADKILTGLGIVDSIYIYYGGGISNTYNKIKLAKRISQYKFDCIIQLPGEKTNLQAQIRNMLFFKLTKVKNVYGFHISTINLFRHTQARYMYFPNEVERNIAMLPFETEFAIDYGLIFSEFDRTYVDKYLLENNILVTDKVLAISFAGKGSAQKWCKNRFNDIAKLWIGSKKNGKVIVLGGNDEVIDGEYILTGLPSNKAYNCCGIFSVKQSMYLLSKISILLSIDTGTAHMASAVGARCIEIFSAYYLPNKWVAYGSNICVIRMDMDCSPCMSKECKYGEFAKCMEAISVELVWNVLKKS